MPSIDINLPKSLKAVFPKRCVACGSPAPGDSVRVCTNTIGWWTFALWLPGRRFCIDVPVCAHCRAGMLRQRWFRRMLIASFAVFGIALGGCLLAAYRGPFKRWLMLGVILFCVLPVLLWEVFFPRPIDLTAYAETVDYEFRDPEYAAEFAGLNAADLDADSRQADP